VGGFGGELGKEIHGTAIILSQEANKRRKTDDSQTPGLNPLKMCILWDTV
jgi:hypothetical protein